MPDESSSKNSPANVRATILVVEDESHTLRLLKMVFLQNGYEVLTAADGEDAIEVFRAHKLRIDVVFLDLGLPKISGENVFLKIKEENPNVCIVIGTGFLEPEVKTEMVRAGVKRFFLKPYMFDEIIEAVEGLIETA
jgi:DNA-binding response OmpR family regulator